MQHLQKVWNVFPALVDPLANLRKFHFADTATCSESVLIGQHPLLPLLSCMIFKRLVDCNIQGLYHTCHPSRNNSGLGVQGLKRATNRCWQVGSRWIPYQHRLFSSKAPTLLHIVLSQSCTSPWSIHPFSWHWTITPFGKFTFFGSVFHLKMSFVPSPRQASMTVNLSFSWPVVKIEMLFTPSSDTVEFLTMSKVSGVWSAFPMYFSSKSCFFLCAMMKRWNLISFSS